MSARGSIVHRQGGFRRGLSSLRFAGVECERNCLIEIVRQSLSIPGIPFFRCLSAFSVMKGINGRGVHRAAILAMALGAMTLGVPRNAMAHKDPESCSFNGPSSSISTLGVTIAQHGDRICYIVGIANNCTGCCSVTGLHSNLLLPDGAVLPMTTNATINQGDSFFCPSADARCVTPSNCTIPDTIGYEYVLNHADERGQTGVGCPLVPNPGTGTVWAAISGKGVTHISTNDGTASICQSIPIGVPHACCEPCTGSCTDVLGADECPFPRIFTGDMHCDEVNCTPLDCDDHSLCTDDSCDAATGTCVNEDNSARCDDNNVCTNDRCDPAIPAGVSILGPTQPGCVHTPKPGAPCGNQTPKGVCDNPDICNDLGQCVQNAKPAGTICRPAVNECDAPEFCDGTSKDCTPDVCLPEHSPCTNDEDSCTVDECDGFCVCTHTDPCGTPIINCPPDLVFECDAVGDFGNTTVEDVCNPKAQADCSEDSTPGKLPREETIIRTCSYTSECGRTVMCDQRIDVVDTTAPVVTCPPDRTFECDAIGDFGEATIEDNCDTFPDVTIEVEEVIKDCTPDGAAGITPPPKLTIVRTITATEGHTAVATGEPNIGTCVQNIEIVDSHPPVLVNCPESVTTCDGDSSLPFVPPTCTDPCGECTVTCVRSDGLPLHDPVPAPPITINCVASDECINESSCEFVVSEREDCFARIPTVSSWGLVILTLLLLTGAKIYFGRREFETA